MRIQTLSALFTVGLTFSTQSASQEEIVKGVPNEYLAREIEFFVTRPCMERIFSYMPEMNNVLEICGFSMEQAIERIRENMESGRQMDELFVKYAQKIAEQVDGKNPAWRLNHYMYLKEDCVQRWLFSTD